MPAILVVVPELRWAEAPPELAGWARANLTLRSARLRTGAGDGGVRLGGSAPTWAAC